MKKGMEKGMKEGIKKGIEAGAKKSTAEIARKMKNAGLPFSEIEEFTGLASQTIETL